MPFRKIFLYALLLALLSAGIKFAEYRFIIYERSVEIYGALIAILFTAVGIWAGLKLTKKKEITVIKEVLVPSTGNFILNENNLKLLNISKREHEVLMLMAEGLSNQEVADKLFVSLNTVKTHSSKLFEKLNVNRRTQAVQEAKKLGLVP
jgi:two-component system, NarL family, response regulator LiaR